MGHPFPSALRGIALCLVCMVAALVSCSRRQADQKPLDSGPADATTVAPAVVPTPAKPPSTCGSVDVRRAWRFRGGSEFAPGDGSELVAVHVRHALPRGFGVAFMGQAGDVLCTDFQFVRATAAGAPLDRFLGTKSYATEARYGPLDLVILGTIPRGAEDVRLWFGDETVPRQQAFCEKTIHLDDKGPVWPPFPRFDVIRFGWGRRDVAKSRGLVIEKTVLALIRARDVLPQEWAAPFLMVRYGDGGRVDGDGVRLAGGYSSRPIAMVAATADGEPAANGGFVVAEYRWDSEPLLPAEIMCSRQPFVTRAQPDPMPAGCPLTSPTTFAVSAALSVSLDESGRVEERYGQVAAALFLHGGARLLASFLDAGTPDH